MNVANFAIIAALVLAGCSSTPSPASQVAPGSKAVPCSKISALIAAIQLYCSGAGAAGQTGSSALYGLETKLADQFPNVSNLDPPQNLSSAEVNYEVDAIYLTRNDPFSGNISGDIQALAQACGVQA